jgi:hypothetical protein
MTLLGKIFTVLIFIMSVLFMGFSVMVSATHKNWKEMVVGETGMKQQVDDLENINRQLRKDLEASENKLAVEQAARRHALSSLSTKLEKSKQDLSEKEAELRNLQSVESQRAEALKLAEQNVKDLRDEVAQLRADILQVRDERDKQFAQVVQLTDKLHAAEGVQKNLNDRNKQLVDDLIRYKTVMDRVGLTPDTPIHGIAPPLDGIVTAVGDSNLIEVSLGWDDGLRQGHRIEVFRDNTYLGYAVILKTDPDRSVAQVDDKTQRGLIKVQDRVATKLSRTAAS